MIIEGAISVKSAISNHKREIEIVYIDKDKKTKDFNYIRKIVKENNIELKELKREELDNIAIGKSFGGVLAKVSNRKNDELDEGDIFYIDGIEDPFNLGYIIRNLYAFGIKNIILSKRDYSNMDAQLLKSSAGAYDAANVLVGDNEYELISKLKENGYHIYGLKRDDNAIDVFDFKFANKCLFMLGGEKRGISSSLMGLCDKYLYIPYASDFRNALNANSACSVVSTLLFAQRKKI